MTCVTSTVTIPVTMQVTMTVTNDIPIPAQEGSRKRRTASPPRWTDGQGNGRTGGRDGQGAAPDGHRGP